MIRLRLVATLLVGLAALGLGVPAVGARSRRPPARMRFSAPALVDHAATTPPPLQALACPSASLCLASDAATGSVLETSDPQSPTAVWGVDRIDDAGGLSGGGDSSITGLACPSARLCVGVDGDGGGVLSTTRPGSASAAWRRVQLPGHQQLIAVACPRTTLCLAADFGGAIDVTTHPAGPATGWVRSQLSARAPELGALTCPSSRLCIAAGENGTIDVSTDPARGAPSFHAIAIDPGSSRPTIDDVACSSSRWCVAGDSGGAVLTTTDPAGPASGWTRTELDPGSGGEVSPGLRAVSCDAAGLCAAVDPGGAAWVSPAPGAAFATVADAPDAGEQSVSAIACPTSQSCLAVGGAGLALRSSTPAIAGSWTTTPVATDTGTALTGISCPTTGLCVAIDGRGDVLSTTTPGVASSWRTVDVDAADGLAAISCPTTTFCAVADDVGDVLTTSDPTGPASAWATQLVAGPLDSGSGPSAVNLTGMACASARLCITGDEDPGEILTSTDPAGPASAWSARTGLGARNGLEGFNGGSCTPGGFCVAISGGTIDASSEPAADASTTVRVRDALDSVSCTSRSFCAAVQGNAPVYRGGDVWDSADPAAAHPRWQRVGRDPREQLGVSCVATALCVAVDAGGRADISFAPRSTRPGYAERDIDALVPLTGVSCPTASECVAVDDFGRVVVGRREA